jgi:hypothetical protein
VIVRLHTGREPRQFEMARAPDEQCLGLVLHRPAGGALQRGGVDRAGARCGHGGLADAASHDLLRLEPGKRPRPGLGNARLALGMEGIDAAALRECGGCERDQGEAG